MQSVLAHHILPTESNHISSCKLPTAAAEWSAQLVETGQLLLLSTQQPNASKAPVLAAKVEKAQFNTLLHQIGYSRSGLTRAGLFLVPVHLPARPLSYPHIRPSDVARRRTAGLVGLGS